MPDIDWTTVALIALGVIALIALVWALIFLALARHVARFQREVAQSIRLGNDNTPTWKSSTTVRRPNPRFRHGRPQTEDEDTL